jgi:putative FmdB family regulatory protein
MPIYEYECRSCGVHFDRKQSWHDEPVKECPDCLGAVRKVLQPVGIVFKGPGFYKTDNSSSGERLERKRSEEDRPSGDDSAAKTPDAADSQTAAKADAKADSRSDAKTESKSDTKTGGKSGAGADSRADSKADVKSGARSDASPDARSGEKSEAAAHSKSGESSQDR